MVDEIIFAQMRLFRAFWESKGVEPRAAAETWDRCGVWDFIESCYDSIHLAGDEPALRDIDLKLAREGAIA